MEFTIQPDQFEQLAWAAKAAPQRPPAPVLTGVRLILTHGGLTAETFDYTTHTQAHIDVHTDDEGTVIVSGRLLAEIIKALPKKPAHFRLSDGKLEVKCGASKFRLNIMDSDYPTPPTAGEPIGCVNADVLFDTLHRALTSAAKDDTLPVLSAVKFEAEANRLSVLSTDRYRLSVTDMPWDGKPVDILVPAKTLQDVVRALHGDITVSVNDRIIGFSTTSRRITVTLTDGDFPQVRRLIPSVCSTTAVINVVELAAAVKRVSIVVERGTPIRLDFHDDTVTLSGGSEASGRETLSLTESITGELVSTAFNPAFLLDALESQPTQDVRVGFTHPGKPVLFTPGEGYSGDFNHVLVPVRIPDGS